MQTFHMCLSQSNGLFLAQVANIDSIVLLTEPFNEPITLWVVWGCSGFMYVQKVYSVVVTQTAVLGQSEVALVQKNA